MTYLNIRELSVNKHLSFLLMVFYYFYFTLFQNSGGGKTVNISILLGSSSGPFPPSLDRERDPGYKVLECHIHGDRLGS